MSDAPNAFDDDDFLAPKGERHKLKRFPLRHPLATITWYDQPPTVLPVGTVVTVHLFDARSRIEVNGKRHDVYATSLLRACAKVPCPYLSSDSDSDDMGGHYSWWTECTKFDGGERNHTLMCQGDMCKCPSSKVRAEAKAQMSTPIQGEGERS